MNDDTVVELPRKRIKVDLEGDQKKDTLPANEVAKLCYEAYLQLGKSGKPDQRVEHTVLACVVESAPNPSARVPVSRVVALATGTKCFPQNLSRRQECIVDCHAESLLKRAFKCYLIDLFEEGLIRGRSIDQIQTEVLNCRNYCLFISQTPCGCVSRWKGVLEETTTSPPEATSLKSFKVVGINRKPGRGEPCPKAGCIHKVAKWTIFGLQGRHLFGLTQRAITFNRIVLGNCESSEGQFECEEMNARLRVDEDELKCVQEQLRHTELFNFDSTRRPVIEFANEFRVADFLREDEGKSKRPCGSSIAAWLKESGHTQGKGSLLYCQVIASGRKLGASKAAKKEPPMAPRPCDSENEKTTMSKTTSQRDSAPIADAKCKEPISRQHRPADLAVSDSGLNQRVDQLVDRLSRCGHRQEQGNDSPGDAAASAKLNDGEPQLAYSYAHNWQLVKQFISIFKGWPSIEAT